MISFSTRELVQEADKINEKVVKSDIVEDNDKLLAKPTLDSVQIEEIMKPIKENQKVMGLKDEDIKLADSIMKSEMSKSNDQSLTWDFDKIKWIR